MREVPTVWIRCKVSPGMFSPERLVMVYPASGDYVSMFVDERLVKTDEEPNDDHDVDGLVRVWECNRENGEVTVMLPVPTRTRGRYISVPVADVQQAAA